MSDQQATGVLRAATTLGLHIPGDLAVSGFDDLPTAEQLGLTTVAQSLRAQGAACAYTALGRQPQSMTAEWSVVVRASTRRR